MKLILPLFAFLVSLVLACSNKSDDAPGRRPSMMTTSTGTASVAPQHEPPASRPTATASMTASATSPKPDTFCGKLRTWEMSLEKDYALDCETPMQKGCQFNSFGVLSSAIMRTMLNDKFSDDMKGQIIAEYGKAFDKMLDEVKTAREEVSKTAAVPDEVDVKKSILTSYDDLAKMAGAWKKAVAHWNDHVFTQLNVDTAKAHGRFTDRKKERATACGKLATQ
jgi:hypothetical protein